MMLALLAAAATVPQPNDYRRPETWLCRPGREDACSSDQSATVVLPDGSTHAAPAKRAGPQDVDCFYVYPTASLDQTDNSDMHADREELGTARAQFAPFGRVCRTFAPIYRQVTLTALRKAFGGGAIPGDWALAYGDVLAAWHDYLAHDNGGRPFVLIGHSQGSMMLKRLVAEEIDGKPIAKQMLSAILPGTAVLVPAGKDVGGDFKQVPLCRTATQTGCVVTWASYRDTATPPANALFGVSRQAGMTVGCTNPARLEGGAAPLDPIMGFPWWRGGVAQYERPATGWSVAGKAVPTDFVKVPGLLSAQCVVAGGASYLAVHVTPGKADTVDNIVAGTATVGDIAYPDWGFHVIDMALVEGDLVNLVAAERAGYRKK